MSSNADVGVVKKIGFGFLVSAILVDRLSSDGAEAIKSSKYLSYILDHQKLLVSSELSTPTHRSAPAACSRTADAVSNMRSISSCTAPPPTSFSMSARIEPWIRTVCVVCLYR